MRLPSVLLALAATVALAGAPSVPADAAVLGDPGKVAFHSSEQGAIGLVGSGGGAIQLPVVANAQNPAWSPDGLRIAFERVVNGNRDIYVAKADGTGEQRVTTSTAVDRSPAWAPDGQRLAFVSNHLGKDDIYTADADGVGPRRLTDISQVRADSPSWAPDGSAVVFGTRRVNSSATGIARVSTAGTGTGTVQELVSGAGISSPELSPDGTRVAYVASSAIWVMNANGTGQTKLPVSGYQVPSDPTWAPDAGRIAFSAYPLTGGGKDVFWMRADGSGVVRVTSTQTTELQPSWQAAADRTVRVGDVTVVEGGPGQTYAHFELRLDQASWHPVTVRAFTMAGTAAAMSDFAVRVERVTFAPGQVSRWMTVAVVGDDVNEPDETFSVRLDQAIGATIVDDRGVGTIRNDDAPTVSVADMSVVEGASGSALVPVTVRLSKPSAIQATVRFAVLDGTATSPSDYSAQPVGTAHFEPGAVEASVTAQVSGDALSEDSETVVVRLSEPSHAVLGDSEGVMTILNDEPGEVSVGDVSAVEDSTSLVPSAVGPAPPSLRFTVRLAHRTTQGVRVRYTTLDGTAFAGLDYTAVTGSVLFEPGATERVVEVPLLPDNLTEGDESVQLRLAPPVGGTLVDGLAIGTIADNDCPAQNCS